MTGAAQTAAVRAGVAVRDITPAEDVAMSGYAVRTAPSAGVHDPLTVRALVVERTALVTVDVVGLHEDTCALVRAGCRTWADHVLVHATHTHGGPVSMPGRLGTGLVTAWLDTVVLACREAVAEASRTQQDVTILAGYGTDPGVAHNRRRPDGPVDPALPVLQLVRTDASPLATLVSYACHPVVLGADNLLLTADYPGVVRRSLEERIGGTVLFATACAGDQNTGHSPDASALADTSNRTFVRCEEVGAAIVAAARDAAQQDNFGNGAQQDNSGDAAPQDSLGEPARHRDIGQVAAASTTVEVCLDLPSAQALQREEDQWAAKAAADPERAVLYEGWRSWAAQATHAAHAAQSVQPDLGTWQARVNVLRWGPAVLITLPGEPFCQAGLELRRQVAGAAAVFVLGYTDGCPGYLPTATEYPLGGYEVCDAHRYYQMPGPFAPGSLERVVTGARELLPAAGVATTGEPQDLPAASGARRTR